MVPLMRPVSCSGKKPFGMTMKRPILIPTVTSSQGEHKPGVAQCPAESHIVEAMHSVENPLTRPVEGPWPWLFQA